MEVCLQIVVVERFVELKLVNFAEDQPMDNLELVQVLEVVPVAYLIEHPAASLASVVVAAK